MHRPGLFTLILAASIIFSCNKKSSGPEGPGTPSNLRLLGYLYSDNYWNTHFNSDLSQLTDLNLAFVNPDENGEFTLNNNEVTELVNRAHASNVRVYISLGGAEPPQYFSDLLKDDKRATLVNNLVALTEQFNLDGVDVDLEGNFIDENYPHFVSELHAALKAKNKLITAALPTWNGDNFHDSTLNKYDYINIMSYDKTGPWDPSNPGQHSPFEMAASDAQYYIGTRGINAAKILIGVPFYGRGFGNNAPPEISYKDILTLYPGAENKDMVEVPGGGKIYYNGREMINRKVKLAKDLDVAGVMIWELNQDTRDAKSLLKTINESK